MKNIKKMKSALSLFLAVTLVFAIAAPLCLSASADGGQSSNPERNLTVYYYTDSVGSDGIRDLLYPLAGNLSYGIAERYLQTGGLTIAEYVNDQYHNDNWFTEENALVIFELSNGYPFETIGETTVFLYDVLYEVFAALKANGCKVMFICNTDERQFWSNRDFLEFVDIHVNTDFLFLFMSNVLYRMYANNQYKLDLEHITLLLDYSMSKGLNDPDDENEEQMSRYYKMYIRPFLREAFCGQLRPGRDDRDAFSTHDIQVLCHIGGNEYYNYTDGTTLYVDSVEEFDAYLDNRTVYAIGSMLEDEAYFEAWVASLIGMRHSFPVYVYGDGSGAMARECGLDSVYSLNGSYDLTAVLEDFLLLDLIEGQEEVIESYNNWEGWCRITHKPAEFSEDGWIVNVYTQPEPDGAEGFVETCWNCVMDYIDREYYYGTAT